MKLLFDLFPVILFFATFKYYGSNPEGAAALVGSLLGSAVLDVKQAPILLATIVVIVATMAQIAWVHFRHGKVDKMLWVSLALVTVFGGMMVHRSDIPHLRRMARSPASAWRVAQLLARGLAPTTSSLGRAFDAACGLLGLHWQSDYEGQAPMALEALVQTPQALSGG